MISAQNYKIDYYGIVCDSIDSNMAKMTSDLYYTQLCEIPSFEIADKRENPNLEQIPDTSIFSDTRLSFYTEIKKNSDDTTWCTTIVVYDKLSMTQYSKSKNYDSFYKILVESKQNLQETIKSLIQKYDISEDSNESESIDFPVSKIQISSESLSGNWAGEDFIDKIMIMRGGRGFIIFNNGAAMNISISITDTSIEIKQSGKSNASFFPELPRNLALTAALSAEPIVWKLESTDSNTLVGKRYTLLPDNDSYRSGSVDVVWKKIN